MAAIKKPSSVGSNISSKHFHQRPNEKNFEEKLMLPLIIILCPEMLSIILSIGLIRRRMA
jgi:hypothetical protein